MTGDTPPKWAKLFVDGQLEHPEYPFAPIPHSGIIFNIAGSAHVFEIVSAEDDPDRPGRFIVQAKRVG